MRYLGNEMRKSLAIKFFALQHLLSTIPNGFEQFPSVDFKLRWKRSVKNSIFCSFRHFQLIFTTNYHQDAMRYALTIKKFLFFNACFLRISKALVQILLQA